MNMDVMGVQEVSPGYEFVAENPGVPVGYKQTEVGVIPEDWEVAPLGDCLVARPGYGINAAAAPYSDKLPTYIRITDISEEGRFKPSPAVSVRSELAKHYYLSANDIVFARTGASVGKSYLYRTDDGPLVYAGFLIRVTPDQLKLNPGFLAAYVTTARYWQWVRLMSMRSGQPGINGAEYSQLPVPLPSLDEQRAIATALSDVDALLEELDRLITKKRDIKQATMQQLLTGETRLAGFEGEWETKRLGECLVGTPNYGINAPAVPFSDRLPTYIRITDINNGRFDPSPRVSVNSDEAENYRLEPGDVVFARTGASVGKTYAYNEEDGILVFAGFLIRVRTNPGVLLHDFLAAFTTTGAYWNWVSVNSMRSGQPGINGNEYARLEIPLPSVDEQKAIVEMLSDMDAEIQALEHRRSKIAELKQGMMQELLTGRTRLV